MEHNRNIYKIFEIIMICIFIEIQIHFAPRHIAVLTASATSDQYFKINTDNKTGQAVLKFSNSQTSGKVK